MRIDIGLLQFGGPRVIPVWLPAGGIRKPAPPVIWPKAIARTVAQQGDKLAICKDQRIVRAHGLHGAICAGVIFPFRDESSEKFVPGDEHARIIGIQITRVGCMVDPVMAWRVEHSFEPGGHLVDRLCVDPELVKQVQATGKENDVWVEPDHDHRQAQQDQSGKRPEPGLTQRCCEVVMGRGMVGDMLHPPPAGLMSETVFPVIDKIVQHKADGKAPPGKWQCCNAIGPGEHHHPQCDGSGQRVHDDIAKAHGEGCQGVSGVISALGSPCFHRPPFPRHAADKYRNRQSGCGRKRLKLHSMNLPQRI